MRRGGSEEGRQGRGGAGVRRSDEEIAAKIYSHTQQILWVVVFAWILERERPKIPVMVCVAGLITGAILLGYQFSKKVYHLYLF